MDDVLAATVAALLTLSAAHAVPLASYPRTGPLMVALLSLNHSGESVPFASSTQCPSFTADVSASIVVAAGDDQQFRSNLFCPLPATLLEMQSAALAMCDGPAVFYASSSQCFSLGAD